MKKITIALDVDGVLADLVGRLCKYLAETGEYDHEIRRNLTPADFKTYALHASLNPAERRCLDVFSQLTGACTSIPWYEGARLFVRVLQDIGEVYAVTAPWRAPTWAKERQDWLSPVIDKSHVISCPSEAKPWCAASADVLIEDRLDTLRAWRHVARPDAIGILFDRPWNRGEGNDLPMGIVRARSYGEAARIVASLRGMK